MILVFNWASFKLIGAAVTNWFRWPKISAGIFLLWSIVFCGFVLRVVGLGWGFPLFLSSDELWFIEHVVRFIDSRGLNPAEFRHPYHISIYLNAIIFEWASWVFFHQPVSAVFPENPHFFYYCGRVYSALLGTLSILIGYLIGALFRRNLGIFIAFSIAFFPSFVLHSHFIKPEIPFCFFILCALYCLVRVLFTKADGDLRWACFFSAVSVAEKFPALVLIVFLIGVVVVLNFRQTDALGKTLARTLLLYGLFIVLLAPFLFFRLDQVLGGILVE